VESKSLLPVELLNSGDFKPKIEIKCIKLEVNTDLILELIKLKKFIINHRLVINCIEINSYFDPTFNSDLFYCGAKTIKFLRAIHVSTAQIIISIIS
jgi:hypothetical protein